MVTSTESNASIAVIEELAENIYSVKFILQSLGYSVESFSSRGNYLAELEAFSPGLIIVDMLISGGGGYEVLRQLRGGALKDVPVVAITADAMEGDSAEVKKAGVTEILVKPYNVNELQEILDRHLPDD